MNIIINLRQEAKNRKDWAISDKIREELNKLGIIIKDQRWSRLGKGVTY